ncbi:hypothetical protein HYALB_00010211 [Hymenoscyphus albidus]|uniref:Heterokaryon incompatibility domain-containing protein n=1 Tax=Hymenoscyphus albidus TaxID=595503 RepID=A0A9N9LQH5_9HELO|nr:hypothetical protein HYALB_00010211 [Hymenoscyphus albidus]
MLCKNCSDVDIVAALSGKYQNGVKISEAPYEDGVWISRTSNPELVWVWEEEKGCEFCEFLEFVSKNFKPDRRFLDIDNSLNIKPCSLMVHGQDPHGFDSPMLDPRSIAPFLSPSYIIAHPSIKMMFINPYDTSPHRPVHYYASYASSHEVAFGPSETIDMTDNEPTIRELSIKSDLSTFRDRLHTCIQQHDRCQLIKNENIRSPSHLRVIDCSSHNFILAPKNARYAALSYQWGNSASAFDLATNTKLPTALPASIKDSIAATLSLGLKYLWVDAYCIVQNNEDDFKYQIRQMDLIYQLATITIIAATGTNSDSGLSGASHIGSRVQAKAAFRGFSLLTFSTITPRSIQLSGWCSRGWTYQEGFFSRRTLLFAEDQILFNCEEGTVAESHTYCRKEPLLSKWRLNMPSWSIYMIIEDFSGRHLTFPADILNAFEGVLNTFCNMELGFKTYWGIPMPWPHDHKSSSSTNFLRGLSWRAAGKGRELCRREGFPSWSWTGWIGPVNYFMVYGVSGIEMKNYSEWRVDAELDSRTKKSRIETESITSTDKKENMTSGRLWISGPSVRVIIKEMSTGLDKSYYLSLDDPDSKKIWFILLDARFEYLDPLNESFGTDTRRGYAIWLYSNNINSLEDNVFLLISRRLN